MKKLFVTAVVAGTLATSAFAAMPSHGFSVSDADTRYGGEVCDPTAPAPGTNVAWAVVPIYGPAQVPVLTYLVTENDNAPTSATNGYIRILEPTNNPIRVNLAYGTLQGSTNFGIHYTWTNDYGSIPLTNSQTVVVRDVSADVWIMATAGAGCSSTNADLLNGASWITTGDLIYPMHERAKIIPTTNVQSGAIYKTTMDVPAGFFIGTGGKPILVQQVGGIAASNAVYVLSGLYK